MWDILVQCLQHLHQLYVVYRTDCSPSFCRDPGSPGNIASTIPARSRQCPGRNARIFLQILGFSRCCGTCLVNFQLFWGPGSQLGAMPPKRRQKGPQTEKVPPPFEVTFSTFLRFEGVHFLMFFRIPFWKACLWISVPKGLPKGCPWELI